MGAASSSSGAVNTAGAAAALSGGSAGLPPNFERVIAGMQKDLEYAQKVRRGPVEGREERGAHFLDVMSTM